MPHPLASLPSEHRLHTITRRAAFSDPRDRLHAHCRYGKEAAGAVRRRARGAHGAVAGRKWHLKRLAAVARAPGALESTHRDRREQGESKSTATGMGLEVRVCYARLSIS